MEKRIEMSEKAKRQKALDIRTGRIKEKWLEDPRVNEFINALLEMTTK